MGLPTSLSQQVPKGCKSMHRSSSTSSPRLSGPTNPHKIHVAKVLWVSPYAEKDEERCKVRLMLTVDQSIIPFHSDV